MIKQRSNNRLSFSRFSVLTIYHFRTWIVLSVRSGKTRDNPEETLEAKEGVVSRRVTTVWADEYCHAIPVHWTVSEYIPEEGIGWSKN